MSARVALVGIATLLAGVKGAAQDTAVLAVDGCNPPIAAVHARALRESLARRMGAAVQSEELTGTRLGGVPRGSLGDAERSIAGARVEFYQSAWDRAERTVKSAIDDLWRLPPSTERWADLREAHTLLAFVHTKQERRADAEAAIERILRVEPDYRPDSKMYPPALQQLADSVRSRVKKGARATIAVATRPAGLPIYLDGREIGAAPVSVPQGDYLVEANYGGRRGLPRRVRAERTTAVELSADFDGAVHPEAGPCLATSGGREGRLAQLVRLAAVVGARTVVAVREDQPASGERYLVAQSVDAALGQETREAKVKMVGGGVPFAAMERLADFIATGDAAPPVEALRGAVAAARPDRPAAPAEATAAAAGGASAMKIGGFVAAGLGVVLGGAAGFLALSASGQQGAASRLLDPQGVVAEAQLDEALQREAAGTSQARLGVIAAIGAGVLVAAGAGMIVLAPAPSPGGGDGFVVGVQGRF